MQKITPFLWFDKEAGEAAKFYTSIFKPSKIKNLTVLDNTPSGKVEIVAIEIFGQKFSLMSAGPHFKFTPAVSFLVTCNKKEDVDTFWNKLSKDGMALMELGEYPFSKRYGWVQDKYGLSWQIMFTIEHKIKQKIVPTLLFVGKQCGRAEDAINFYTSIFNNAKINNILRYEKNEGPDKEGTVKHAVFTIENQEFAFMDSAHKHNFTFNEAISFVVSCKTQKEIDYFWNKLSANPKAEQCGWLKDKFGLSWQVIPDTLGDMLGDKDKNKVKRVTEAFLKMKKFDLEALKKAYEKK